MDTKVKAEIVTDFVEMFAGLEPNMYEDFFQYNDLGIPLAIAYQSNLCSLTPDGVVVLDETYNELLKALKAPTGDYESLDDIMAKLDEIEGKD